MTSASAISRLLKKSGFPVWSFSVQQLKTSSAITVDQEMAATPEMLRMISELQKSGYETHLNGSRFIIAIKAGV
jgi:hypothetical protein